MSVPQPGRRMHQDSGRQPCRDLLVTNKSPRFVIAGCNHQPGAPCALPTPQIRLPIVDRRPAANHQARHHNSTEWGRSPTSTDRPPSRHTSAARMQRMYQKTGSPRRIIGPMSNAKTAGQKLVALLDEGLPNGVVWTASERATLGLISDTADRVEVLKKLLAAEVNSLDRSTHRCAEVAGEIRMAQAQIAKMVAGLDPEMVVQAKSVRHQNAARARWNGVGISGPAQ